MKKILSLLALIFVVFCLCYGAYEEGRFQQKWEDVGRVRNELKEMYAVDTIPRNGIPLNLSPFIDLDSCTGLVLNWEGTNDCDSIRGIRDTITWYKKDGTVITTYRGDTIKVSGIMGQEPFLYAPRPISCDDTTYFQVPTRTKKHLIKRDKWGHILRDTAYIDGVSGDIVFPEDVTMRRGELQHIGTGFWSKSVDPHDWPFPGRDGLAYAQFTWDEVIWSDGKSHNGENFDSVFNVLHNQLVKTWWDSLMSTEYIDTISGFLLIKACDDSFPTRKIHYYWDSIMYNTKNP